MEKLGGSDPNISDKRKHFRSLFHLTAETDPSSETLFWEYHTGNSPGNCVYWICKVFLFINNFWVNHHVFLKTHINAVSLEGICRSWLHIVMLSTPLVRHKVLRHGNPCVKHTHTHTHIYTYTHVHTHTCTQTHTYTHTHVHTHMYTYTHMYTHTHVHTHVHTNTHTHSRLHANSLLYVLQKRPLFP
jgi:hypothetical protein